MAHRMLSFIRKAGLTHRISVRDDARPHAGIALHFGAITIASAAGSRNSGYLPQAAICSSTANAISIHTQAAARRHAIAPRLQLLRHADLVRQ
ncbi:MULTISPECIES: hypothetical protein [Ralstonia]|uniref:hypothetical protein n=1 Tax=Ralstonia TaxID=48736 RepID=UPI00257A1E7C|nr:MULTISPECIES: hypothetical protein [Ralstonia]